MDWIYCFLAFLFAVLIWLLRLNSEKEKEEFWYKTKRDYDKRNPNGPPFEM